MDRKDDNFQNKRKRKTRNYLNNNDLLEEISKSKYTFCSVKNDNENYKKYDIVLEKKEQLCSAIFFEVLEEKEKLHGKKFQRSSIVIRVMTDEHIPEEYSFEHRGRKNKEKKLNFDPFKHYILNDEGEIEEVLRSHWKGTIEDGEFSMTHGYITENLGKMIILLVDRFAQKSSFRGYSWVEDIKGKATLHLLESVLKFREVKSENPFAYFTTIITNSFRHTLNQEHKNIEIKTKLSQQQNPAFQTYEQQAKQDVSGN